jgi:hypothetical protein
MGSFLQLIFGVVGGIIGYLYPPLGIMWGFFIGMTVGGLLFPSTAKLPKQGPAGLQVQTSTYGGTVPVLYGTRKMAGNVVWYGNFARHKHKKKNWIGMTTASWYTYTVSIAIVLCMGPLPISISRVWAGKDELDFNSAGTGWFGTARGVIKVYDGTQTTADPTISAAVPRAPVWKNVCYVVLPNYNLDRIPQIPNFTFEVGGVASVLQEKASMDTGDDALSAVIDTAGGYAYFARIGYIDKVRLSDFVKESSLALSDSGAEAYSAVIDVPNQFAYFGTIDNPGKIYKINLSTFTETSVLTLDSGDTSLQSGIIHQSTGYSYWGTNTSPGKVIKVDVDPARTFSRIGAETLSAGENFLKAAVADTTNGYGYFGTWTDPAKIVKIDIDPARTFEKEATVTFPTNEDGAVSAVIDIPNQLAYFGTNDSATNDKAYIVKVNIAPASFARIGSILTNQFEAPLDSAVIDLVNGYAYFGTTGYTPSDIVQLKLADFTISGRITLSTDLDGLKAAVIDEDNALAYFGGLTGTGNIIKIGITGIVVGDVTPVDVTEDIITNDLYGVGLDGPTYLDSAINDATKAFCNTNDLLISPIYDTQISVLDALNLAITHHDGFISHSGVKIGHNQLKEETPIGTLEKNINIVEEKSQPSVNASRQGARDYNNKIIVQYTKRANEYVDGTALTEDIVDIDKYGLMEENVNLSAFTTFSRANKMANRLLRKSMSKPESFQIVLGSKNIDVKPGEVYNLTYPALGLSSVPIRILAIRETDDFKIEIDALEEKDIYELDDYGEDTSVAPVTPTLIGDPGDVQTPMAFELPAVFSGNRYMVGIVFAESGLDPWAGAVLYGAYSVSGDYTEIDNTIIASLNGTVDAVGWSETLAANYIEVTLDTDEDPLSAASFDELMSTPQQNIFVVKRGTNYIFCRYQDATLVSGNKWRLSGLVYNITGFGNLDTYGDIQAGDTLAIYNEGLPFGFEVPGSDAYRTLYYKLPSFNFNSEEQDLTGLSSISATLDAFADKPLPIFNVEVGSIGLDESDVVITASGADIVLTWKSQNRFGEGIYNYNDPNLVYDDVDFVEFEIEIYEGANLLRTVTTTNKTHTYTAAQQTTDGGPYSAYTIKIRQFGEKHVSDWKSVTVNTA